MELTTTGKTVSRKTRVKPKFVTIGDERRIDTGRWNYDLMADWIVAQDRKKWQTIGALAKVPYGSATINNKKRVRGKLRRLHQTLMDRGHLLLIEYELPHNRACTVKLYDANSELDRQTLDERLESLQQRGDLLRTEYERARQIAEAANRMDVILT